MQSCQAQFQPCQNAALGSSNFFTNACIQNCNAASTTTFHQCCTAPGSACLTNPNSCGCAQQVQTCQATSYPCQNVGLGTQSFLQQSCSTCSNANLLNSFHSCCNAPGSACNQINTNNQWGNAPAGLACNCSLQVQQCQQANQGCQNAAQGSALIVSNTCSTCSSAQTLAFQQCVNTGFCAQVETTYPFGGAPTSLLCQCAQQVQACQQNSQYSGCTNADWGTQAFLNNVCNTNTNANGNGYGNGYGYGGNYKGSATTIAVSAIAAVLAVVASF